MKCVKGLIVFNIVDVCGIADEFMNSYGDVLRKIFKLRRENEVLLARLKIKNVNHNIDNTLSLGLFLQPTLMHNSITTCMSHYYPRHVAGLDMPILRRNNCTNTASVILAFISGCTLDRLRADCSLLSTGVVYSEDTRCCVCAVVPPEDGHVKARNMSRIVM